MDTYILDGIPADLVTQEKNNLRRFKVDGTATGTQRQLIFKRLSTSTGETSMNVNGSITPVEYYLQPEAGQVILLARWMLFLQDAKGFDITTFGSNGALTNGLSVELNGQNILGYNVKTNGDIAGIVYDMTLHTFGNADDVLVARWSFYKAGQFIRLTKNDKLSVVINDDLTGISEMYVQSQGYYE